MNVHVLATVLKMERLPTALLLFKTARIGFPTANITVYGNGLGTEALPQIAAGCQSIRARFIPIKMRSHGDFVEALVATEKKPFWISDTDIVFRDSVEDWFSNSDDLFAGRLEPKFFEPWTKSVHVARLHPSLMWINPSQLRAAMRAWPGRDPFFNLVEMNLIKWSWVPVRDDAGNCVLHFYDICAGLHQALGGTRFTEAQNEKFGHLFCGTYADKIAHVVNLQSTHAAVCENPELAFLLQKEQDKFYELNATK